MVERAAGRRDDDVRAAFEGAGLLQHRGAAVHGHDAERRAARVLVHRLGDLHRELARRDEHEAPGAVLAFRFVDETLNQRERERRGLARAGGRLREQIAAGQHDGNRFTLNGRGLFVAERRDGGDKGISDAESRETCALRMVAGSHPLLSHGVRFSCGRRYLQP